MTPGNVCDWKAFKLRLVGVTCPQPRDCIVCTDLASEFGTTMRELIEQCRTRLTAGQVGALQLEPVDSTLALPVQQLARHDQPCQVVSSRSRSNVIPARCSASTLDQYIEGKDQYERLAGSDRIPIVICKACDEHVLCRRGNTPYYLMSHERSARHRKGMLRTTTVLVNVWVKYAKATYRMTTPLTHKTRAYHAHLTDPMKS